MRPWRRCGCGRRARVGRRSSGRRGRAGFDLGFKPGPGFEGDGLVAGVVIGGAGGFGVGGGGIEREEFEGVGAEVDVRLNGEAVGGGDGGGTVFVGDPAGEQGDVGLLAGGVDVSKGVGEEIAVDDGPK
jgi:hypothetical protein